MTAIARREDLDRRYVARLLPLAWLAPAIVEAIITEQAPAALTAEKLTRRMTLPLDWSEQQSIFGGA